MSADVATALADDAAMVAEFRGATGTARTALFDRIFRAHRRRMLALCQHLCGNRALAEDALQEAFLDVYRGLPGFRGEAQLGTWI